MEKEFVKYTEALALKELGFNEPCFGFHSKIHGLMMVKTSGSSSLYKDAGECLSPTYSQAFRWFEDNHQLYPAVVTDQTSYPKYAFEIASFFGNPKDLTEKEWGWNEMVLSRSLYRTKTEAELECLKKLIEIVKEK